MGRLIRELPKPDPFEGYSGDTVWAGGDLGTGFNDGGSSGSTTNLYLFGLAHIFKKSEGRR